MAQSLDKITIKGFKSIRSLEDFELSNLNVLIGGNGAGKSNFIDFFRMLRAMLELPLPGLANASLKTYIAHGGDSTDFLFNGPKITEQIEAVTMFGKNGYCFKLAPTTDQSFIIIDEERYFSGGSSGWWPLGSGQTTPELLKDKDEPGVSGRDRGVGYHVYGAIFSWKIYHFHDTSESAPMRRFETIDDDEPELGLHPYAIEILAELIQAASKKTQLIVSTQSPALIDYFKPEDIIVVNRKKGESVFERLNEHELSSWLEEYSLGDIWRKNIIAGGPAHE